MGRQIFRDADGILGRQDDRASVLLSCIDGKAGLVKVIAGLLLAFCMAAALAQEPSGASLNWTLVSAPSPSGCTFYIDQASIAIHEAYREAWFMNSCNTLQPSSNPGKPGFMSTAFLEYFDCKARKVAIAQLRYYSGKFATGVVLESYDWSKPPKFEENLPNSNEGLWLAMVCRGIISPPAQKQ